jgi:cystathionine beta-lyase
MYDFDELIERRGTGCVKWDEKAPNQTGDGLLSRDIIPLWVADMDFKAAPAIQEAIKRRAEHGVFGYTHVDDSYYDAVVSWYERRHQWTIKREWLLYTTGVVPAISAVLKALTLPGERVITLTPAYNCFFSSIRNTGCELAECRLRWNRNVRFEIPWDELEALCRDERTTVLLLCNPHNPTGRVWSITELRHIAIICRRHHVQMVSDEIHCELVMPECHFTPLGYIARDVITLSSPSKSFNIAGLQMANIICRDAEKRRRIERAININEVCDVNPFAPEAVKAAYNESEKWIDELNQYLWDNYRALRQFAAEYLPQWKVRPLEGTYLPWVDITATGMTSQEYADHLLQEARVWVNPGTMYGQQAGEGYIRLNIACPRSRLMEALERIGSLKK